MNNAQLGASAALPGPLPISTAKSGALYAIFGMPVIAASTSGAPVANQVVYTPIFVPFAISLSKLGVFTSGSPTASAFRCALYAFGTDGLPGNIIYDFGYNVASSGLSSAAASAQSLSKGWYYLAFNTNTTSYNLYGLSPSAAAVSLPYSGLMPLIPGGTIPYQILNAAPQTFGVFPSTPTVPTISYLFYPAAMQAA